jgi:hypothetical protein
MDAMRKWRRRCPSQELSASPHLHPENNANDQNGSSDWPGARLGLMRLESPGML